MKSSLTLASVVSALLVTITANAGTVLKLNKGNIETAQLSNQISAMSTTVAQDYVIQFKNAVSENEKSELAAMGVQVFRYLPEDALIVRAEKSVLTQYQTQSNKVNAIVPFFADWKLSTDLPTLSVFSVGQKDLILISAFTVQDRQNIQSRLAQIDSSVQILAADTRYLTVSIQINILPQVAALSGVEFVQKVDQMKTMDMDLLGTVQPATNAAGDYTDLTGYETGTKILNMDAAWSQGLYGVGQIVGMADTGLDTGDATKVSNDFQGAIKSGYFFGAGAKDWSDPMGHGTHVAGSVLGRGTISGGKIRGAAYGAQFVPEAMWSPIIDNLNVPAKLEKLFTPAYNDGARVHTNSWGAGSNFGAYEAMAQSVDQFMWDHPDFLILFAAGNSGVDPSAHGKIDPNSIGAPATSKNCVTVGASKNLVANGGIQKKVSELRNAKTNWPAEPIASSKLSETPNGMAMFSSRGPVRDNRIKPDVVAPGTNVLSSRSHIQGTSTLWGEYNADYLWSGGTSMATPLAAGFAAVTREVLAKKFNVVNPSASLVKAVMMHTAFDMYPGQFGEGTATQELTHRPNNDEGYGRLDMAAIMAAQNSANIFDNGTGVAQGETFEISVTLTQGQKLTANMVYTDAPGTPSAAQALVNNLDLVVVTPAGQELGSHDTLNNAEIVEATNLAAGTYKVQVKGVSVPMGKNGKQPFALVVSVQ